MVIYRKWVCLNAIYTVTYSICVPAEHHSSTEEESGAGCGYCLGQLARASDAFKRREQGHHEVTEFNLHGLLGLRLSLRLLCPWVYERPPGGCFGVFQKLHRDVSWLSRPKHGWEGEECWWGHLGRRWGVGVCGGIDSASPVKSASAAFNALMPFLRAAA